MTRLTNVWKKYLKIQNIFSRSMNCPEFESNPVHVLSDLTGMYDSMVKRADKGVAVHDLSAMCDVDKEPDIKDINALRNAKIILCDNPSLIKYYQYMELAKWISSTWVGVDNVISAIPEQPPFIFTKHGGKKICSLMAEYVISQIINWERNTKQLCKNQESSLWKVPDNFFKVRSLDELVVGFLGVGNMASESAGFLRPRVSKVFGFAKRIRNSPQEFGVFTKIFNDLGDFLDSCDYIINTLPSTISTKGMLNGQILQKCCPKQPVFINVGRGNIIDERSLLHALKNEWISGAILDVFEVEPLLASSELWRMPNVIITPHVSAVSKPDHIADEFFKNYIQYVTGRDLKYTVQWSKGY